LPVVRTVKSAAPVPEIAGETVSDGSVPTFITVRLIVFVVPCVIVPNPRLVVDTDTSDVPVPVVAITGLVPPLVVTVTLFVSAPREVTSYSRGNVQLLPGAIPEVQVLPVESTITLLPLLAALTFRFGMVPTLDTVTSTVLVVP
jgi:hypothetical protein